MKNKKLFLFDPLLYRVFAQLANLDIEANLEAKIIEGVVGSELLRTSEADLFEGFSSLSSLFY